jgi:hypothetical protein
MYCLAKFTLINVFFVTEKLYTIKNSEFELTVCVVV